MSTRTQAASKGGLLVSLGLAIYGLVGPPAQVGCGRVTGYGPATLELLEPCPKACRLGLQSKCVGGTP